MKIRIKLDGPFEGETVQVKVNGREIYKSQTYSGIAEIPREFEVEATEETKIEVLVPDEGINVSEKVHPGEGKDFLIIYDKEEKIVKIEQS
jgi:hypothetical protein